MSKLSITSLLLVTGLAWTASLSPLQITGPDSNRIRLIIVGDGFTQSHQDMYDSLSEVLVNSIFISEPFKTYKSFFNIYRLNTISRDSGISDDYMGYYAENAFNTTSTAIGTMATDTGRLADTLRAFFPDWSYQSKKSFVLLIANSNAPVVECFKIADNVASVSILCPLKKAGPYKFGQLIGNFVLRCAAFSGQDLENLVQIFHQRVRMYDAFYPFHHTVALGAQSNIYSVQMTDTMTSNRSIKWYLDDQEIAGANGFSHIVESGSVCGLSTHQLKCRFRDISTFNYPVMGSDSAVFNPFAVPDTIMTDSVVWTLPAAIGTESTNKTQAITKPFLGLQRAGNGFEITVASPASFQLAVYDVRGRLIRVLGQRNSGNAETYTFRPKAAGIYIARLLTAGKCLSKKAVMAD